MESHSSPHTKTKACYKTEPRSKNQHQVATVPPDVRGGNGFQLKKEGKSKDSSMQTKTPSGTVPPSTQTALALSAKASPATSRAPLVPAAAASSSTSTTLPTTKIPDTHAVGITQGTTVTTGSREHKIKYSREGELKNSFKNIHKTKSQISTSTDSQKSVQKTRTALPECVQQTTFSQTPKTTSIPKQQSSPTPTTAVDQADTFFKGSSKDMAPSLAHQFKSNDNKVCVKEDSREAHRVQPLGTKQSKEETLQRNKDKEENRGWKEEEEEGIPKDVQVGYSLKGTDITLRVASKCPLFPLDRVPLPPGETTTSALNVKKTGGDNIRTQIKSFNNAATMTEQNPVPLQTLETAMQTELLYVDAEIQAVIEVGNKSTSVSPNMTRPPWSQMDHKVNLSNHDMVSGTASMSLHNGRTQDDTLDSGLPPASVESAAKDLRATPYKSSMSSKPTKQHVCQIQIELCSQSTLSDSQALPAEKDSQASPTRSGHEREPEQVDRERDQADSGRLPEVAWDEQGMTWEVYGAAVDMESLGFAIQNHLQHKIQEHEQRIRHLRKSVSLSEHSNSDEKGARKKKKKKIKKTNVFRSLFQRPTCCLTTDSEA